MQRQKQSMPISQNRKLTLAYDGTNFHGWQIQPEERTIQGELQAALGRVTGESPLPQGSGRTDAGVHALGQVASFPLQAPIPDENLLMALNRTLPSSIRVLEVRSVRNTFHARHSAHAKTYEYRIFPERPWPWSNKRAPGRICPPFLAPYVGLYPWPLKKQTLQQAAQYFVGEHDFLSFAASDPDLQTRSGETSDAPISSIRTIYTSEWEERSSPDGSLLVYRVRGNGFLHHMVRNLVGTMLEAGRNLIRPEAIPAILTARSRSAAGPTATASGLFLHSVEYDEDEMKPDESGEF
jgi:tRNA pseudouridine38-40 synthase